MTSAPVKDVSSLMNYVGGKNLTKTGGTDQMSSFGDVMSRTRDGNTGLNSQSQVVSDQKTAETRPVDTPVNRKDIVQTEKPVVKAEKDAEAVGNQEQILKEAGEQIVSEVSQKFGVTEEEVLEAMEVLGLSGLSLLEPSELTKLVLELSGGQDTTALLTDETLFGQLQGMLDTLSDVKDGLTQELNLNPEEMQMVVDELQKASELQSDAEGEMQKPEEAVTDRTDIVDTVDTVQEITEDVPKITVEVKSGEDTVKLEADEKGNVTRTMEFVSQEKENVADQKTGERESGDAKENKGQSESALQTGNPLIDSLLQNKVQAADTVPEQATTFFDRQTQDIMNQIMDYMKIQLNPEMDQLEMQLHPESLGTVHIQLTSKSGEVTAQFQVQNETVRAALESQITTLQESLREQGIKVEAVQVTVENHGFESNLWQGQGREENASSQNQKRTPRRINLDDLDRLFEDEASEEELLAAKIMEANGNTVDYTA